MNTNSPKSSAIGKLRCKVTGHRFVITHRITDSVNEYQCAHCKEEFSTNSNGKLVRLTQKTREINACLGDFFSRRAKSRVTRLSH